MEEGITTVVPVPLYPVMVMPLSDAVQSNTALQS